MRPNDAGMGCGVKWGGGGRPEEGKKDLLKLKRPWRRGFKGKVLVCAREFLGVIYSSENGVWLFTS